MSNCATVSLVVLQVDQSVERLLLQNRSEYTLRPSYIWRMGMDSGEERGSPALATGARWEGCTRRDGGLSGTTSGAGWGRRENK